jgi:anti-sigma regulatory factor (Ser/Thr protein kinase)
MTSPTPFDDEQIDVVLPLRTRYAATLRVIAAALGADAGFSVDEIDDLRLGLNEVFALLADGDGSGRVRTTFRLEPGQVTARLAPEDGPVDVRPDDLALTILRSVVDEFSFDTDGVVLVKRAVEHDGT